MLYVLNVTCIICYLLPLPVLRNSSLSITEDMCGYVMPCGRPATGQITFVHLMFLTPNPTSRIPQDSHTPPRRPQFHQRSRQKQRYGTAYWASSPTQPTRPGSHDSPAKALCIHPKAWPVSFFHSLLCRYCWVMTGTRTSPQSAGRRGFHGRDPAGG